MENTWEKICLVLAKTMQYSDYTVWISPQKAKFDGEKLTVIARNDFIAKFLRTHFQSSILEAAKTILGYDPALQIESLSIYNGKIPEGFISVSPSSSPEQKAAELVGVAEPEQQTELPVRWNWAVPSPSAHKLMQNRFSFDNFVVGPCNEFAHAAARRICQSESPCPENDHFCSADLLFLCSAPGLGKTHLMQSVGVSLMKNSNLKAPKVEYLTAEEFTTQMRQALDNKEMSSFKARFRGVDVLLLENVHFLLDKTKTQEELLATLIALLTKGSRVVLSSSFSLPELRKMDSQLFSRLSSGLVAPINHLDKLTTRRIITYKAGFANVKLAEDVTDFLADNINSDVRQIESCLKTLIFKARVLNQTINIDLAREVAANCLGVISSFTLPEIIRQVCEAFGISADMLNSKSRKQEYVHARNAIFYLARQHTGLSLQEIGRRFNRTHSTVIKGITSFEREISRQTHAGREFAGVIERIERHAGMDKTQALSGC
jgi:chromosomal replication initiator protein